MLADILVRQQVLYLFRFEECVHIMSKTGV